MSQITEIHYWGHASYSLFNQNCHLLIDPVLSDPFEHGNTFFNPPREIEKDKLPPVDIIYISHAHRDHFDEKTLRYFLKDSPQVFCPDDPIILNALNTFGFDKVKPLTAEETISFGPYTLFTTPSLSAYNELGVVVIAPDVIIWNQVDTSVDLQTIWKVKHKLKRKIDILFCPFQPLKEYCLFWPDETEFPEKRLENLIIKALSVRPSHIIPSSCSIKIGNHWEYINSRVYPITKCKFVQQLKRRHLESINVQEIETGSTLCIRNNQLLIDKSYFIKQTGVRIDFNNQPHPTPPPLNSYVPSEKSIDEITLCMQKLPSFLSDRMNREFIHYLECMKAYNYCAVIEVILKMNNHKTRNLTFLLKDRLKKLVEQEKPDTWDYWFQYGAGDLINRLNGNIQSFIKFYAYRNPLHKKRLKSPLTLYGHNEDTLVDGYEEDHFLYHWPFHSYTEN